MFPKQLSTLLLWKSETTKVPTTNTQTVTIKKSQFFTNVSIHDRGLNLRPQRWQQLDYGSFRRYFKHINALPRATIIKMLNYCHFHNIYNLNFAIVSKLFRKAMYTYNSKCKPDQFRVLVAVVACDSMMDCCSARRRCGFDRPKLMCMNVSCTTLFGVFHKSRLRNPRWQGLLSFIFVANSYYSFFIYTFFTYLGGNVKQFFFCYIVKNIPIPNY